MRLLLLFLLFPSICLAQNTKPLIVTDNTSTCNATRMVVSSGTLACSGSTATVTTGGGGGGISGLTTNTVPKATSSTTIGDSHITDDGTTIKLTSDSDIVGMNKWYFGTDLINYMKGASVNSPDIQVFTFDATSSNATGGTITVTGGNAIHTFTSSGTFTPSFTGTVSVLVIAGGGGGGYNGGGGGGAGGYRTNTTYSVTSGVGITVTIGAAGAASSTSDGGDGGDSVFGTITSTGGGGGRQFGNSPNNVNGRSGGSGGGAGGQTANSLSGGAGNTPSTSPSQGNNGGANQPSPPYYGGGGGGAGGTGGTPTAGIGTANSISGSSVTYCVGGGGGNASGAGTSGSTYGSGGFGGNGAGGSRDGGVGQQGVVIVSYTGINVASETSRFTANGNFLTGVTSTALSGAGNIEASATIKAGTAINAPAISNLTTNGYIKTSGGVGTLGVQAVPIPIADGGTNGITATAAFNNLSPMTTAGDLIQGGASGAGTRTADVAAGSWLRSGGVGVAFAWSTPTLPNAAGTAGKVIISDGTNFITSTPTFPNASATALKHIRSDGTNWIASTVTYPDASVTAGKVIISDGTNYIASTPTFANTSTSGNVLRGDGTNWLNATLALSDLSTFSSSTLAGRITDETGTGLAVFGTSPRLVTSILDTNGNTLLGITATGSSVNYLALANAATGNAPTLTATGTDTNIGSNITNKGTGGTTITSTSTIQSSFGTGIILGNPGVSPGHLTSTGTAPTVATNDCGSTSQGTVAAGSTDVKGKFTVGTLAVTSCSITFNTAFASAPTCITQDDTNVLATKVTTTTTKLTTIGSVSLSGDTVSYICVE